MFVPTPGEEEEDVSMYFADTPPEEEEEEEEEGPPATIEGMLIEYGILEEEEYEPLEAPLVYDVSDVLLQPLPPDIAQHFPAVAVAVEEEEEEEEEEEKEREEPIALAPLTFALDEDLPPLMEEYLSLPDVPKDLLEDEKPKWIEMRERVIRAEPEKMELDVEEEVEVLQPSMERWYVKPEEVEDMRADAERDRAILNAVDATMPLYEGLPPFSSSGNLVCESYWTMIAEDYKPPYYDLDRPELPARRPVLRPRAKEVEKEEEEEEEEEGEPPEFAPMELDVEEEEERRAEERRRRKRQRRVPVPLSRRRLTQPAYTIKETKRRKRKREETIAERVKRGRRFKVPRYALSAEYTAVQKRNFRARVRRRALLRERKERQVIRAAAAYKRAREQRMRLDALDLDDDEDVHERTVIMEELSQNLSDLQDATLEAASLDESYANVEVVTPQEEKMVLDDSEVMAPIDVDVGDIDEAQDRIDEALGRHYLYLSQLDVKDEDRDCYWFPVVGFRYTHPRMVGNMQTINTLEQLYQAHDAYAVHAGWMNYLSPNLPNNLLSAVETRVLTAQHMHEMTLLMHKAMYWPVNMINAVDTYGVDALAYHKRAITSRWGLIFTPVKITQHVNLEDPRHPFIRFVIAEVSLKHVINTNVCALPRLIVPFFSVIAQLLKSICLTFVKDFYFYAHPNARPNVLIRTSLAFNRQGQYSFSKEMYPIHVIAPEANFNVTDGQTTKELTNYLVGKAGGIITGILLKYSSEKLITTEADSGSGINVDEEDWASSLTNFVGFSLTLNVVDDPSILDAHERLYTIDLNMPLRRVGCLGCRPLPCSLSRVGTYFLSPISTDNNCLFGCVLHDYKEALMKHYQIDSSTLNEVQLLQKMRIDVTGADDASLMGIGDIAACAKYYALRIIIYYLRYSAEKVQGKDVGVIKELYTFDYRKQVGAPCPQWHIALDSALQPSVYRERAWIVLQELRRLLQMDERRYGEF